MSAGGDRDSTRCAARTTCRAAATWARCRIGCRVSSTSRTTKSARAFDRFYGVTIPPKKGWHLSGMFDAMERGELKALYVIGENPLQSEADQHRATTSDRAPRVPGRAGYLPDRNGAARRRGVSRGRRRLRIRRHGHQQRAARAARAQDDRSAGRRARRPADHRRPGAPARPRLAGRRGVDLERAAAAVAGAYRHELRRLEALDGLRWPCYDEQHPGRDVPARAVVGAADQGPARAVLDRHARAAAR